jgi:hypothetical protein
MDAEKTPSRVFSAFSFSRALVERPVVVGCYEGPVLAGEAQLDRIVIDVLDGATDFF